MIAPIRRPTCRPRPDRGRSGLQTYLGQIHHEILTAAEERTLVAAIVGGDAAAVARLVRCNLRLVVKIARGYLRRGLDLEDLIGEGNLGLMRAVRRFDPRYEVRFATYAGHWIKESIRRAIVDTGAVIRLPNHVYYSLTRWRQAERALARRLGRVPSFGETAAALDLGPYRRAGIALALRARAIRLHAADAMDGDAIDTAASPETEAESADERAALDRALGRLSAAERAALSLRYGLDGEVLTNVQIARRLGYTREWVRKVQLRALRKLEDRR